MDLPQKMPATVREIFEWIHALHQRQRRLYKQCRQLFDSGPHIIHLLTITAPGFFSDIRLMYGDELSLSVCRLLDPAMTGNKPNVSVKRLIKVIRDETGDSSVLVGQLESLLSMVEQEAAPIRESRNRRISHIDLETHVGGREVLLKAGTTRMDTILALFDGIVNNILEHYGGYRVPEDIMAVGSDADRLVAALRDLSTLRAEELERGLAEASGEHGALGPTVQLVDIGQPPG